MSQQTISSPSLSSAVVRKEGPYRSFSGYGVVALIVVLFITGVLLVLSHTPVLAGAVTYLPWYFGLGTFTGWAMGTGATLFLKHSKWLERLRG